jgi:hypothetical protein
MPTWLLNNLRIEPTALAETPILLLDRYYIAINCLLLLYILYLKRLKNSIGIMCCFDNKKSKQKFFYGPRLLTY